MVNIVVADGYTLNPGDLGWEALKKLGRVSIYDRTPQELLFERIKTAEVIIVNKQMIGGDILAKLPKLKCICVTATGVNNVDLKAARNMSIAVSNVIGYSSPSVAQHVFALLLEMTNQVSLHDQSVSNGDWSNQLDFSYTKTSIYELSDLTMGIYGLGRIGRKVAQIALAFGMKVLAHHKHPERDAMDGIRFVDLKTLFTNSNVISLHAPLNADNIEIVNNSLLRLMPKPAFIINTGRGGLIDEKDLKECLQQKMIQGAGLDVLSSEPPPIDHPLLNLENCILTPHLAWASKASRQRLLDQTILNVANYLAGKGGNLF